MSTSHAPAPAPGADTLIVLLAHGSRDPMWREAMDAMAEAIRQRAPQHPVGCAFLELCDPALDACVSALRTPATRRVRVLPLFLGMGKHLRQDLPERLQALRAAHPDLDVEALSALADQTPLRQLVADLALGALA